MRRFTFGARKIGWSNTGWGNLHVWAKVGQLLTPKLAPTRPKLRGVHAQNTSLGRGDCPASQGCVLCMKTYEIVTMWDQLMCYSTSLTSSDNLSWSMRPCFVLNHFPFRCYLGSRSLQNSFGMHSVCVERLSRLSSSPAFEHVEVGDEEESGHRAWASPQVQEIRVSAQLVSQRQARSSQGQADAASGSAL